MLELFALHLLVAHVLLVLAAGCRVPLMLTPGDRAAVVARRFRLTATTAIALLLVLGVALSCLDVVDIANPYAAEVPDKPPVDLWMVVRLVVRFCFVLTAVASFTPLVLGCRWLARACSPLLDRFIATRAATVAACSAGLLAVGAVVLIPAPANVVTAIALVFAVLVGTPAALATVAWTLSPLTGPGPWSRLARTASVQAIFADGAAIVGGVAALWVFAVTAGGADPSTGWLIDGGLASVALTIAAAALLVAAALGGTGHRWWRAAAGLAWVAPAAVVGIIWLAHEELARVADAGPRTYMVPIASTVVTAVVGVRASRDRAPRLK